MITWLHHSVERSYRLQKISTKWLWNWLEKQKEYEHQVKALKFDSLVCSIHCRTCCVQRGSTLSEGLYWMSWYGRKHSAACQVYLNSIPKFSALSYSHSLLYFFLINLLPHHAGCYSLHQWPTKVQSPHSAPLKPNQNHRVKDSGSYRNSVATEEDLYKITYYGKGRMPVNLSSTNSLFTVRPWTLTGTGHSNKLKSCSIYSFSFCCVFRALGRNVLQGVRAHLDHSYRRMRSISWRSL